MFDNVINIDDQLVMEIDPFQREFDNEIIFKENDIEDINVLIESKEYIKELNRLSLRDIYKLDEIIDEILDISNQADKMFSLENSGVVNLNEWIPKQAGRFKSIIIKPLKAIYSISKWIYRIVKRSIGGLWNWAKGGKTLKANLSVFTIGLNLRAVAVLLAAFLIAARQYIKIIGGRKEKQDYKDTISGNTDGSEALGHIAVGVSAGYGAGVLGKKAYNKIKTKNEDKQIKVIKHSELIRVVNSYENILRSCERILDNIAIFKYNTVNEMAKEVPNQDLKTLQLSIEGTSIRRERLKMERNTISNLGYTMDIKKYQDIRKNIFKKYENFIRKEVSFTPKAQGNNTSVRQMGKMIRTVDKIAFLSCTVTTYHVDRAINSLKYIE